MPVPDPPNGPATAVPSLSLGFRSVVGVLAAVALAAGTAGARPAEAASRRLSVVAFGDSVPSGTACGCTSFVDLYAAMVAHRTGSRVGVQNFAHQGNGNTSGDIRRQVQAPAAQAAIRGATTVIIMVGANDFIGPFDRDRRGSCSGAGCYASTAGAVRDNVTATLQRIRSARRTPVSVVVLDYWNVVKDGRVGRAEYGAGGMAKALNATAYANRALHAAAQAQHAAYVSTRTAFRGRDDRQDPTPLLAADGDHPDARGHRRIAETVFGARPNG